MAKMNLFCWMKGKKIVILISSVDNTDLRTSKPHVSMQLGLFWQRNQWLMEIFRHFLLTQTLLSTPIYQ